MILYHFDPLFAPCDLWPPWRDEHLFVAWYDVWQFWHLSSLAEIWHWEGPKILTSLFNQTPYLMVFFQLVGKNKNKYGSCYCSSSQSIKPSSLMCPAARNVWDTEGGLMAKNDKNYQPSTSLSLRNVQQSLCGTGRGGEGRGRQKKVANTLYVEDAFRWLNTVYTCSLSW